MVVHLSEKEGARLLGKKPRSKFNNTKTVGEGGFLFDSDREATRWRDLRLELAAGEITKLRRQVRFALAIGRVLICEYVADFVYVRDGEEIVEDAKGVRTAVYRLKKKLMLALHGIEIQEV